MYTPEKVEELLLCLRNPTRKYKIVDYHSTAPYSVISEKIYNVLEPVNIKGVQFTPTTITGVDNELYEDYRYIHVYNVISALDMDNSDYEWNSILEIAEFMEKLVLDNDALGAYPLEERLVFRLKEDTTFELYHKSIVDKIMSTNPDYYVLTRLNNNTYPILEGDDAPYLRMKQSTLMNQRR